MGSRTNTSLKRPPAWLGLGLGSRLGRRADLATSLATSLAADLAVFGVSVMLVLAILAPVSAWAQSAVSGSPGAGPTNDLLKQQVRALIHEAGQLMDRGDRQGAADRLQQARALWPDPSLDYNLGIVYADMGQHPQAAQALQRFLSAADRGAVLSERLEDARRRLDTYQRTLARLSVKATLPAGELSPSLKPSLSIDQQPAQALPIAAPLWMVPGVHLVRVTASGATDYEVKVELVPGALRELSAELRVPSALATAAVVPATPELELRHASEQRPLYKKWWFWSAIGGGALSIVGFSLAAAGASGKLTHVAAGSDLDPVDVAR